MQALLHRPARHLLRRHVRHLTNTSSSPPPRTIAIAGAGLAGLTSALELSRALPSHRILLLESSRRLGGWVQSERIELKASDGSGKCETALLEAGPRSIRPKGTPGLAMLSLIKSLNLQDELLLVPKTAPSAKNRFLYYPDQLQQLPSSLLSLPRALFLPSLRGLIPALASEFRQSSRFARPRSESKAEVSRRRVREEEEDESVSSYMRRRFGVKRGNAITQRLLSAVLHGIYAASPDQLSVRSVMPVLWEMESRHGGLLRALLPRWANKRYRDDTAAQEMTRKEAEREERELEGEVGGEWWKSMKEVSVYSFKEGVEVITRAMQSELERNENVSIVKGAAVKGVSVDEKGMVQLDTSAGPFQASRLISALPSTALDSALSSTAPLPWLSTNPSSTVGVVNLAIPSWLVGPSRLLSIEGFGYLIPSATANPRGILGVVFDSDSLPTQDGPPLTSPTKFTVMIGGPHWRPLGLASNAALPTEADLIHSAKEALTTHLSIPPLMLAHADTHIRASLQQACIPTYTPGHPSRMRALHAALLAHEAWKGKLALVGASYTGVALNDCVLGARRTARRIISEERNGAEARTTGLERFARVQEEKEVGTTEAQAGLMPSVTV